METLVLNQSSQFSLKQLNAIEKGRYKREWMLLSIQNITSFNKDDKYSNLYIYSPPGLGKTYSVNQYLKNSTLNFIKVSGNTSMFAFGIQLAVINYLNPERLPIIVHVDDCDEIFKNEQNCNAMKKILDEDKSFVYEKSLSSQWSNLSEVQQAAIEHFGEDGKMGFVVPTDNMRFIFTSNFQLPNDDEVSNARKKSKSKATLLSHLNAIRSRCKVTDFELTKDEHWGWLSDVIMNTDCLTPLDVTEDEKVVILDYVYYNWSYLTERSVRLVEKMTFTMRQFPETYKRVWDISHLKTQL